MTRMSSEEFVEHFGVKGMKWGVRKDRGHEGQRATSRKISRLDKKFEKNARSINTSIKVYNRAAELTNKNDIDRINDKPEYAEVNFNDPKTSPALRKKYYKEHQNAFRANAERAVKELGTNASGTKRYAISSAVTRSGGIRPTWELTLEDVKHTNDEQPNKLYVSLKLNEKGHILSMAITETNVLEQSDAVDDFLEHYGVKGMKWGVRRSAAELGRAAKQQKQARKDAKAATARTRYVKGVKDAPRNLTDDELKKRISRMETEKKYNELNAKTVTKGQQLTSEVITNAGKKVAVATLASGGALIVKNAIMKKFKLGPDQFNIKIK